jgi:hypothetical protein
MRHTPAAIRQFLIEQPLSGQTVAAFCEDHGLKVPTFYSWKKKYGRAAAPVLVWDRTGFVVWYKVLEQGTFEMPAAEKDAL